jgi:hypothetical protein
MKFNQTMMVCVISVLLVRAATFAFAQSTTTTTATTKTKKSKSTKAAATTAAKKSETTANATDAQIAAAKSSGQVWVNTGTKVYHDSSSEFYGKTKAGKFMAEKDAIAAGYHKSKSGN